MTLEELEKLVEHLRKRRPGLLREIAAERRVPGGRPAVPDWGRLFRESFSALSRESFFAAR